MVGIPQEFEIINELSVKNKVEKHIFIHGYLNDFDMIELVQSCDIFVLLSEAQKDGDIEGFGIAILEANYLGLPAIGSLGCGIKDAIEENINGKLINPNNANELLSAINDIINAYDQYSSNAIKKVKDCSWSNVAKQYIKVIKN